MPLFQKKDLNLLLENSIAREKTYGLLDLVLLGVGAIIGTGILVLTGIIAATDAGPAVVVSFIISAIAATIIGLCYAEVSSSIPCSGSIYGYAWVVLGQFPAHLLGWTMIGVYILTAATVANGWTGYFNALLLDFHITLPEELLHTPIQGGLINLPSVIIVLVISFLLTRGSKESKMVNNMMVLIKLVIITLFIVVGVFYVEPGNWTPFAPFGVQGIFAGAATAFFSFLGFDALATTAEEVKDVQKTLPKAIILSVLVATTLYVAVCLIMTGMMKYTFLDVPEAMTFVMKVAGQDVVAAIIAAGSVIGILAVILAFILGSSNIIMSMGRGGFLPKTFSTMNKKYQSPNRAIWTVGILTAVFSGLMDVKSLANLANIGSLIAFAVICFIVIRFRQTHPDVKRDFKVPFTPLVPILGIAICLFLVANLDAMSWVVFLIWLLLGTLFYFTYSKKHIEN
ncbi:APC family permease [Listeria costaricensis]|uniref:APC family permease n=1 Tax=Listeria costaricensis TaxID=2026604 RepID=UPI000C0834BA|nr:amino acid permease [Listeria costaricensis]